MGKINLNKSADLTKVKKELNKILESRISKALLEEAKTSLSDMSLGGIVNVFESIADKLYEAKGGKKLIAKYVKAIRENKSLSGAYYVYNIVRKSPNVTNPQLFLSEAIAISSNFAEKDKKIFEEGKKKLAGIVRECVDIVGIDAETLFANANKNVKLNESIEYLLFNKKSQANLSEYVNKFDSVCNALNENMQEASNEESVNGKELIDKLNEEFKGLQPWESDALKEISIALISESDLKNVFDTYKTRCMEKLDEAIEESNSVETTSQFESMRTQLSEKVYKAENAYEDIFTLAELAKTISE